MRERATNRRNTAIALYSGGATMQEVGDLLGISRERVRQYLANEGHDSRPSNKTVDPTRIVHALRSTPATAISHVATSAGTTSVTVNHALRELGLLAAAQRLFRARRRQRLLRELRTLAQTHGRTMSAKDLQRGGVFARCLRYYGTHTAALRAAGLPTVGPGQYVKHCAANGRSA